MKHEGYEETHEKKVVTIFSAPNYCDFSGNKAAYIRLKGDNLEPRYLQFEAVVSMDVHSPILQLVRWPTRTTSEECADHSCLYFITISKNAMIWFMIDLVH